MRLHRAQAKNGTFDGDVQADGDTVKNVQNLSAFYSGQPLVSLTHLAPFPFVYLSGVPPSGKVFGIMGFEHDTETASPTPNSGFRLNFVPSDPLLVDEVVGVFRTSVGGISSPFAWGGTQYEGEVFSAQRWNAQVVPEPATFFLCAFALLTIACRKVLLGETA